MSLDRSIVCRLARCWNTYGSYLFYKKLQPAVLVLKQYFVEQDFSTITICTSIANLIILSILGHSYFSKS
jgi:hypothetical protein